MNTTPTGTYRLQLHAGFAFAGAAAIAGYLTELGVSHAYLSPVLTAAAGSEHGYDTVDHTRVSTELGGEAGLRALADSLRGRGLGLVVDVVPNHMAVPVPASGNAQLWSVLRDGPDSEYARWFDIDWDAQDGRVLLPILGQRLGACLDADQLRLETAGPAPVLRYGEHELPVRLGTEHLPLVQLLDQQWYRLADWRCGPGEVNYRRFFDVSALIGVRVEDEAVFEATHRVLLDLAAEGVIAGLRIDHVDGLADPAGYLRRLAERTPDGSWVVVEKILTGDERLPTDWACAGTTGYDALNQVCGLFVDPVGEESLTKAYAEFTGYGVKPFPAVAEQAKRDVLARSLPGEVERLVRLVRRIGDEDVQLRDLPGLGPAVTELLAAFEVYRAYLRPGDDPSAATVAAVERAAANARARIAPELADTVDVLADLALGRLGRSPERDEFVVRFQQTTGPVLAKGVEDTAFYRWHRLVARNEVGGQPDRFGVEPEAFHRFCADRHRAWPAAMTALSTHDTKRAEDVRARLAVLAELGGEWNRTVWRWRSLADPYRSVAGPDPETEYLCWQTLLGVWPLDGSTPDPERLVDYLVKAAREAKQATSWLAPEAGYEAALGDFVRGVLGDGALCGRVAAFAASLAEYTRCAVLGQKLVQLTMVGVPDVYQGTELVSLDLVDPDNRRPVDFRARVRLCSALDKGVDSPEVYQVLAEYGLDRLDAEKLLVTSAALRLRRDHPGWFAGGQRPLVAVGPAAEHAVAFTRGGPGSREGQATQVVTVATRLPVGLERRGGWEETALDLPAGRWRSVLTGQGYEGGRVELGELVRAMPVALLVRG